MRLIILVSITMLAFAANSILNRMALTESEAGAASFAALRLLSGALMLVAIVQMRGQANWPLTNVAGPLSLLAYVIGFSFAYLSLDAGLGALILFGGVQITMFAGALLRGESVPTMRWIGAGFAFAGLSFLMWPNGTARSVTRGGAYAWGGTRLGYLLALGGRCGRPVGSHSA